MLINNGVTSSRVVSRTKQSGQSLVELVIWGSFFIVVFLTMPMIIKVADIKSKHYEAVRYGLWERTIWSKESKSDEQLIADVEARIMTHSSQALTGEAKESNPFWSHLGNPIIQGEVNNDNYSLAEYSYDEAPGESSIVKSLAYDPPIGIDGFGLNGNAYATLSLETKLVDRFNEDNDHRYDKAQTNDTFSIESKGSILSDEWSLTPINAPKSKSDENALEEQLAGLYKDRVGGVVVDEVIEPITKFGALTAKLFLPLSKDLVIAEGKDSDEFVLPVYADVIEEKYKKNKPD